MTWTMEYMGKPVAKAPSKPALIAFARRQGWIRWFGMVERPADGFALRKVAPAATPHSGCDQCV